MSATWQKVRLGDLIELKRGYDLPTAHRRPGPYPVISSSGPTGYHADAIVDGPGVVTGRYGTIGDVFFAKGSFWPLNTALYVRDFKGNEPRFIYYFLKTLDWSKFNDKSGVPGVNRNHAHQEPVYVPAYQEQVDIANKLFVLDEKIELNDHKASTLEEVAQALYRSWFVDFDPVKAKAEGREPALMDSATSALFPDRFSEKGLPQGWGLGKLSDIFDFNPKERLPKGSVAPYIDMKALPTRGLTTEPPFRREFKSGTKFRDGDTLLARITPCLENGKTGLVDGLGEGVVGWGSTEFIVMRSRNGVSPALPYCVARTQEFRGKAIATMTGSSGRQRADASRISQVSHALPPEPVMSAFNQVIAPILDRVLQCGRESRTLADLRDTLLPRLMSGDLRASEVEECIEEVA